jgi:chromosome partitioning protein
MLGPGKEIDMPVIVMATPKGGAGKTTTSLVLGLTLAGRGGKISLIDADDNQPLVRWAKDRTTPVNVYGGVTDSSFVPLVDRESDAQDLVIVDLEGMASRTMSRAIMRSDLVLIPVQASELDAQEAGRMVALIQQEEIILRRPVPYRIILTRTSSAVPTKTTKTLLAELAANGIPALRTHLNERVAYRALFERRCSLTELDPSVVNGVPQALANAEALADEITALLLSLSDQQVAA